MPKLDVEGCNLYYIVKGKGTPIIFIHPPTLTCENFEYQLEELSRNFKVIAFDVRGHGNSQSSSQPITYSLIAKDMKSLLDHLEIKSLLYVGIQQEAQLPWNFY